MNHDPSNLIAVAPKPEDLPPAAVLLLDKFREERVFAFFAPMGAGKTTFIQSLCACLGVEDSVVSPTFPLINEYSTRKDGPAGGAPIYHFDFYRLKNACEALDIGTDEYLRSGSYCFMEWSGIIEDILPERCVRVEIEPQADGSRKIYARLNNDRL